MAKRLPLHSGISVFNSKYILVFSLPFLLVIDILWGLRAKNDPVLVLNAKGGEIKAKAKWISQPLMNFENT
jgi:hypothetical protein